MNEVQVAILIGMAMTVIAGWLGFRLGFMTGHEKGWDEGFKWRSQIENDRRNKR